MTFVQRLTATLALAFSLLSPVAVVAHAAPVDYGDGGIIATPLSAKGRFIFVTKMSRRLLRQEVALRQQLIRPMLVRVEI